LPLLLPLLVAVSIAVSIAVWQKNSGRDILVMEIKAVLSTHYSLLTVHCSLFTAFLCVSVVDLYPKKSEKWTKMDQNGPKWTKMDQNGPFDIIVTRHTSCKRRDECLAGTSGFHAES